MKPQLLLCCISFSTLLSGQDTLRHKEEVSKYSNEFGTLYNGLIYPDSTVKKLKYYVDSLHIKFRVCEPKQFYAKMQGRAHWVELEKQKVKEAIRDMDAGIGFTAFLNKYSNAKAVRDLLVVKFGTKDHDDNDATEFSSMRVGTHSGVSIEIKGDSMREGASIKGKWIYRHYKKSEYQEESVDAFFFPEALQTIALPAPYNAMIQYSECMIDTTAQVYLKKVTFGEEPEVTTAAVAAFINYLEQQTGKPEQDDSKEYDDNEAYWDAMQTWDSLLYSKTDVLMRNDPLFRELFSAAVGEAKDNRHTTEQMEGYIERYYSKQLALELKRYRHVYGMCSMDDRPRRHAAEIARLSAETAKWEIFLRSHLDIMNDRFERASDGSYAWAERKTYIRELEVLDINVHDLLLGISLRVQNPGQHHYYGSIGRLGRALAETQHPAAIEKKMLKVISDKELDDYNRILMYWLFLNYIHNQNEGNRLQHAEKLKTAVSTLPSYLADRINVDKDLK